MGIAQSLVLCFFPLMFNFYVCMYTWKQMSALCLLNYFERDKKVLFGAQKFRYHTT